MNTTTTGIVAEPVPPQRSWMWRLLGVGLFLLLLWVLVHFTGLRNHLNLEVMHDCFEDNRVTGLLIFAGLFALGNLVQIPGWLFLAAAVLALGRVWGGLATYVGACFSCITTYWVIRLLGADALRQVPGKLTARLFARLDAHPTQTVFLLRLLFQTVPALNYALALSGVNFRSYLIGTLLGLPIPLALYSYFFDTVAMRLHWPLPMAMPH